jgi:hypothetical protein
MTCFERSLLAVGLGLCACSNPDGRPSDSDPTEETGLSTLETGDNPETSGSNDTTTNNPESDTADEEFKFDLAAFPDAAEGCASGDGMLSEFSYIWIGNSTQGTVSKIDTVSTIEEGRYAVTNDLSMQSSRTSVNQYGDVAIGHRFSPRGDLGHAR